MCNRLNFVNPSLRQNPFLFNSRIDNIEFCCIPSLMQLRYHILDMSRSTHHHSLSTCIHPQIITCSSSSSSLLRLLLARTSSVLYDHSTLLSSSSIHCAARVSSRVSSIDQCLPRRNEIIIGHLL